MFVGFSVGGAVGLSAAAALTAIAAFVIGAQRGRLRRRTQPPGHRPLPTAVKRLTMMLTGLAADSRGG